MIRLRTLGEAVVEVDGVKYGPDYDVLFAGLVYLTTERGRQVPRAVLAELLWPRLPGERARHNLRQLLYRMRMAGVPVDGAREHVLLPERLVAPTFSAHPAPERLVAERGAGTLVIGAFLPGYDPTFSDPFAEWVERTRATIEGRVRRVLLEVAQAHKLRGEWAEVEALASECLRLDPLNEEATFARAEAIAMVGGKNEAVEILDRYLAELGPTRSELKLPATVLRRRIAERFPARRYAGPSERCFVGRSALMEVLSTALLRARNGEGGAVMLTGAPGIGKTRLVHELTKIAIVQGVRVVRVGVDESDVQRPMAAFVDAVPQLRALPGAIGVSPESLAFLERLTEVHRPSETLPEEPRDPRWIAGRIRQAVVDLCDAVASEGTLLLVVEDVHWLDTSSWASLAALLEWIPLSRALLVLTSRGPHPTPNTPRRCVERLPVHPVVALPRAAAVELARAIGADHGGPLSDAAVEWCVDVGEGNPLFLRELVIHCLEGGAMHAVPPSLKGLLDARIARLGQVARRVLEAAAVLGDLASLDRLGAMLQLRAFELASALGELSEALLLDDAPGTVAPRHELVAARVLDGVPRQVSRMLHQRAALTLSSETEAPGSSELLAASARHWKEAGEPGRAAETLIGASDSLHRIGAIPDAIHLLESAIGLALERGTLIQVHRRLARLLALDGQWRRTASVVAEILNTARDEPGSSLLVGDRLLGIEAAVRSDAEPWPLVEQAYSIAADEQVMLTQRIAAAKRGILIAILHVGLAEQHALWDLIRSLSQAAESESAGVIELEVLFEANVGKVEIAVEKARQLRDLAHNEPDPLHRLPWLLTVAETFRTAGYWEQAIAANEDLLDHARRFHSSHFELRATERIANALVERRRPVAASAWLIRARELLKAVEAQWYREALLEDEAILALLCSRPDDALDLALELRRLTGQTRHCTLWHQRAAITLHAQVQLHRTPGPIHPTLVAELSAIHERTQGLAVHDRTTAALVLALERAARRTEAKCIIDAYVRGPRRTIAPWRPPAEILALAPFGPELDDSRGE